MSGEVLNNLLEKGIEQVNNGNPSEAGKYFAAAVKMDPTSALAWYWLGTVVHETDRKEYCFSRAVSLEPDILIRMTRSSVEKTPAPPAVAPSPASKTETRRPEAAPVAEVGREKSPNRKLSLILIIVIVLLSILIIMILAVIWLMSTGRISV